MRTVAILSQKGGVGKTTLATCLAVAAEEAGQRAAIIDIDPQATASFWHDTRGQDAPAVASVQAVRIGATLKICQQGGADIVFIDGAAVQRDITMQAAEHADLVLIPARPTLFDTMSMVSTRDAAISAGKPYAVLFTFAAPQGRELADGFDALAQIGAPACPVTIGNRKAFFRAQATGQTVTETEPGGEAAREIRELYKYIRTQLDNGSAA